MKHLKNIKELAEVLANMCNRGDYCGIDYEDYCCPFTKNCGECAVYENDTNITVEDWENVIRNLLSEKQ